MSDRAHWFGTPAATYAYLVPLLTHAARQVGYALALHGSLKFDLDLVAIPWSEEAVAPEQLLVALREALALTGDTGPGVGPAPKPHGRIAWTIPLGVGLYVDLSVMPRAVAGDVASDLEKRVVALEAKPDLSEELRMRVGVRAAVQDAARTVEHEERIAALEAKLA